MPLEVKSSLMNIKLYKMNILLELMSRLIPALRRPHVPDGAAGRVACDVTSRIIANVLALHRPQPTK
jgi:hypothetical protein